MNSTLTGISGIRVGHAQDLDGGTGLTVVLCPPRTIGAVEQRGGAPGTRETDLLRTGRLVLHVNAVLLTGGSAFGLAAADGVVRFLEEQGIGFPTGGGPVPIVPAAVLYDLEVGDPKARPDAAMGRRACEAASSLPVPEGTLGAGTGCRVGALRGSLFATKGGVGSALVELEGGLKVAALFAVNSFGDVVDEGGDILAGLRESAGSPRLASTLNALREAPLAPRAGLGNTVIGVVATNALLRREELTLVAGMAHDGIARAVSPAHTLLDGDTIFALSTGEREADPIRVGAFAAEATAKAIRRGVLEATPLCGIPAAPSGNRPKTRPA
jgi:L-aminopeptidase/D-esterase-like protein